MLLAKGRVFVALAMGCLIVWEVNAASLTSEELKVYTEVLRVMRMGVIEDVNVGKKPLLVRESFRDETAMHISKKTTPAAYRSALSGLLRRYEEGYRVNLSRLALDGISAVDSVYFARGRCTLGMSAVGFGGNKQTAVVLVTSGCKEVVGGLNGKVLVCLSRSPNGWRVTDYAVMDAGWGDAGEEDEE